MQDYLLRCSVTENSVCRIFFLHKEWTWEKRWTTARTEGFGEVLLRPHRRRTPDGGEIGVTENRSNGASSLASPFWLYHFTADIVNNTWITCGLQTIQGFRPNHTQWTALFGCYPSKCIQSRTLQEVSFVVRIEDAGRPVTFVKLALTACSLCCRMFQTFSYRTWPHTVWQ